MAAESPTLEAPREPRAAAALRWQGWRLRALAALAALLAALFVALVGALAAEPQLAAIWRADDSGRVVLRAATDARLAPLAGEPLAGLVGSDARWVPVDALLLHHAPRWLPDDTLRERQARQHRAWRAAMAGGSVALQFDGGTRVVATSAPRGVASLGAMFWLLSAASAVVLLAGAAALLSQPRWRLLPVLVLAWATGGGLALLAIASVPGPAVPLGLGPSMLPLHVGVDLLAAAAAVQAAALCARVPTRATALAGGAWTLALLLGALVASGQLGAVWWWTQAAMLGLGAVAVALLAQRPALPPHPLAPVLRRLGMLALATLALLSAAAVAWHARSQVPLALPVVGVVAWQLSAAALLLGVPAWPHASAWREAALMAGTAATTVAIDLLLRAAFDPEPTASLAAAVVLSLALYALVRRWLARSVGPPQSPDADRLAAGLQAPPNGAACFDDAVEQGRREERVRLAQDLHDDIGARLLTLMYQAPTPQIEDYVRDTLHDLKTLTRGLAASGRRLDAAAAEWKADLGARLQLAHCRLAWSVSADRDIDLGIVQWSALTRLLRELVTNVIAHAQATRIEVEIAVDGPTLTLQVSDDGCGRDPQGWSAGLGLASVRKRVRQLGGEVGWCELQPRGIRCRVSVPLAADVTPPPAPGSRG